MAESSTQAGPSKRPRTRNRRKPNPQQTDPAASSVSKDISESKPNLNRRRQNFNAGLTNNDSPSAGLPNVPKEHKKSRSRPPRRKDKPSEPENNDLTSNLIHSLRTPPFPDCLICFNPIRPEHPVWSCNPSIPIFGDNPQYCWTVIHLKCIKPWAKKSVKSYEDALKNRGEEWSGKGEWRCPGCQGRRKDIAHGYHCFCGKALDPSPPRLATPHSCASSCSRPRSQCAHSCPLSCHPGPCPPCRISVPVQCSCPKGISGHVRCAELYRDSMSGVGIQQGTLTVTVLPDGSPSVTCGAICGKPKTCGNQDHVCQRVCHEGSCDPCQVPVAEKCVCSKDVRIVECGTRKVISSHSSNAPEIQGSWSCTTPCGFSFACDSHKCQEICHNHPPSSTLCPFHPKLVLTCPCGNSTIASPNATEPATFPARLSCKSIVPTCMQSCLKILPLCGHTCAKKCHHGPCTPCEELVVRPCRCGSKILQLRCHEIYTIDGQEKELLCDKLCPALRSCGRHRCNRPCCPLASLATAQSKKGKGRQNKPISLDEGAESIHLCDLICNKLLSCGKHQCTERDHKGQCPPCLQSSWEELTCACGRTVMYPPIPCGVVNPNCHERCHRGPLNPHCKLHPMVDHRCHPDSEECPPCAFLVSKRCACNKTLINNVRCCTEKERVGCGKVCGKIVPSCGVHRCERICHPPAKEEMERLGLEGGVEGGGCGECKSVCGKMRKSCLPLAHPCTQPCHAPSVCSEDIPCETIVTLTCSCGRIKRGVQCGRTAQRAAQSDTTSSTTAKIKCTTECAIAKRNAKLADALGITQAASSIGEAAYNDELRSYARLNAKFLALVETTFAEFVNSKGEKKVLPHMPPEKRKFVCELAGIYRLSYQFVDAEPHRSVQLIRRIDSRIPTPLLSQAVLSGGVIAPAPIRGKLTDLRSAISGGSSAHSWRNMGHNNVHASSSVSSTPMPNSSTTRSAGSVLASPSPSNPSSSTPPPNACATVTPPTIDPSNVQGGEVPNNWEDEE